MPKLKRGPDPEQRGFEDRIQQALDELEQRVDAPMGDLRATGVDDTSARVGDLVAVDGTQGAVTVALPPLTSKDKGGTVLVLNASATGSAITILAAGNDTINGAQSVSFSTAWGGRSCVAVSATEWVAF